MSAWKSCPANTCSSAVWNIRGLSSERTVAQVVAPGTVTLASVLLITFTVTTNGPTKKRFGSSLTRTPEIPTTNGSAPVDDKSRSYESDVKMSSVRDSFVIELGTMGKSTIV